MYDIPPLLSYKSSFAKKFIFTEKSPLEWYSVLSMKSINIQTAAIMPESTCESQPLLAETRLFSELRYIRPCLVRCVSRFFMTASFLGYIRNICSSVHVLYMVMFLKRSAASSPYICALVFNGFASLCVLISYIARINLTRIKIILHFIVNNFVFVIYFNNKRSHK